MWGIVSIDESHKKRIQERNEKYDYRIIIKGHGTAFYDYCQDYEIDDEKRKIILHDKNGDMIAEYMMPSDCILRVYRLEEE